MKAYHIGYYIRKMREENNIGQDELCHGICDRSTLSRIERGRQEPAIGTLKMLLQRLGMDEDQFSMLLGPRDFTISNLQKEIVTLNVQKEYAQAVEKISRLEKIAAPEDRVVRQFILRCKALVMYEDDYLAARQMLTEALFLTHPNFDFDQIGRYLLSIDEVKILNQIASTYSAEGNDRYGIHIYRQLFEYPRSQLINTEAESSLLSLLAYNYSRLLGRQRRYEECLEVAQMGYDTCVKYNKCQQIGGLLLNIACALHELGRDEECKEKLIDSYYAHRIMRCYKSCELILNYARDTFGEELL